MKRPNIDTDTPLVPEIIADTVTQDKQLAEMLCNRARWHYAMQASFRSGCRKASGREYLAAFMHHWSLAGHERMKTFLWGRDTLQP